MEANKLTAGMIEMEKTLTNDTSVSSSEEDHLLRTKTTGGLVPRRKTFRCITTKQLGSRAALQKTNWSNWFLPAPTLGIFALCIAVGCMFFSLAILLVSNNKPITSWMTQPTVYLAVAAAIANSAVAIAHAQASTTAWWYQASQGASIRRLERQWEASFSMGQALLHFRGNFSLAMGAGLLVASMIADGPMLQRATKVIVAIYTNSVSLSYMLAPEIPTEFSGNMISQLFFMTHGALKVTKDWEARNPIIIPVEPACEGSCTATIRGPGVAKTNCSTICWPISDAMYHDANAILGRSIVSSDNFNFMISLTSNAEGGHDDAGIVDEGAYLWYGSIDLDISKSVNRYVETSCWWIPAIIEYDVTFTKEKHVSISSDPFAEVHSSSLMNNTRAWNTSDAQAIQPQTYYWLISYLSAFFLRYVDYSTLDRDMDDINGDMYLSFKNPTSDIIQSLNEMIFRAAVMTATWSNLTQLIDKDLSPHQTTNATESVTQNVFRSDFRWYFAAIALELIVILSILPLFWGWWTLDKNPTLSPFGLALAFNAPIMENMDTNGGGVEGILTSSGDVYVRYDAL